MGPLTRQRSAGYNDGVDAGVMKLADVTDSKSVGLITRVGSSPTTGTILGPSFCPEGRESGFFVPGKEMKT